MMTGEQYELENISDGVLTFWSPRVSLGCIPFLLSASLLQLVAVTPSDRHLNIYLRSPGRTHQNKMKSSALPLFNRLFPILDHLTRYLFFPHK